MLSRNVLFCCNCYNWTIGSFISRSIPLSNIYYTQQLRINLTDFELNSAISLMEVMFIGEKHVTFPDSFFSVFCTINWHSPHCNLHTLDILVVFVLMSVVVSVPCVRINIIIIIILYNSYYGWTNDLQLVEYLRAASKYVVLFCIAL